MRVAVEGYGRVLPVERTFQPGRSKKGEDFRLLAQHRGADGGVVEKRDFALFLAPGERLLEP